MHMSDCALHSAPARRPKPCDCGATLGWLTRRIEWLRYWVNWRNA